MLTYDLLSGHHPPLPTPATSADLNALGLDHREQYDYWVGILRDLRLEEPETLRRACRTLGLSLSATWPLVMLKESLISHDDHSAELPPGSPSASSPPSPPASETDDDEVRTAPDSPADTIPDEGFPVPVASSEEVTGTGSSSGKRKAVCSGSNSGGSSSGKLQAVASVPNSGGNSLGKRRIVDGVPNGGGAPSRKRQVTDSGLNGGAVDPVAFPLQEVYPKFFETFEQHHHVQVITQTIEEANHNLDVAAGHLEWLSNNQHLPPSSPTPSRQKRKAPKQLKRGDRVAAHYRVNAEEAWFAGRVTQVTAYGHLQVTYDDKEKEVKPPSRVRPWQEDFRVDDDGVVHLPGEAQGFVSDFPSLAGPLPDPAIVGSSSSSASMPSGPSDASTSGSTFPLYVIADEAEVDSFMTIHCDAEVQLQNDFNVSQGSCTGWLELQPDKLKPNDVVVRMAAMDNEVMVGVVTGLIQKSRHVKELVLAQIYVIPGARRHLLGHSL